MSFVAFTVYFEVVPARGLQKNPNRLPSAASSGIVRGRKGGRFDMYRDLQSLAVKVYEAMETIDGVTIAQPGGSQYDNVGRTSSMAYGTGAVPQIGNSPARLMLEGFVDFADLEGVTDQPNPNTTTFAGNEVTEGVLGAQPWLGRAGLPTLEVEDEVALLKKAIENSVAGVVDDTGMNPKVFRIFYKGSTWGDRGHHFPQKGL